MNLFNLLFFFLGTVFGSFISALSYRNPRGISNTSGRSFCDRCKKQINWYDNIPLLSYLFLGGKCRNCKNRISLRYPLIEASTGIIYFLIFSNYYPDIFKIIYLLIIFSLLIMIFVVDLENKIIPDEFVFMGMIISILYLVIINGYLLFSGILAGFLCALILLLIHLFTKGRGMGLGDVKFAVWGGMFIGLRLSMVWLLLAFLTGGVAGIILILLRKAGMKDQIAFGPFLVFALGLTLIIGEKIILFIGL